MTAESRKETTRLLLLGLFVLSSAALLPGHALGVGVLIVGVAFAAFIVTLPGASGRWNAAFMISGLSLLGSAAVRDAAWIVVPAIFCGVSCLIFAAQPPRHLWDVIQGWLPFIRLLQGWRSATSLVESAMPSDAVTRSKPLLRGVGLAFPLIGFFGVLFASADRAFAHLVGEAILVDVDVALVPARFAIAGWAFAIAGGMHGGLGRGAPLVPNVWNRDPWGATGSDKPHRSPSSIEWLLPLGSLNLLFGAFVVVQFAVLFGGRTHVLATTGLSYAEYARSGFFQLLVVAGVVLLVIAGARHWVATTSPGEKKVLEVLLCSLSGLTLVVLASAIYRLGLYEDAFGPSRARFEARLVMVWLASLLVMAIVRGFAPGGPWLLRGAVLSAATTMLLGLAVNPDAMIARGSVERFEATGEVDAYYLSTLSADAVPELLHLPKEISICVIDNHLGESTYSDPWSGWNLGRERARDALAETGMGSATSCPVYGLQR